MTSELKSSKTWFQNQRARSFFSIKYKKILTYDLEQYNNVDNDFSSKLVVLGKEHPYGKKKKKN